ISEGHASVATVAVDAARDALGDLAGRRVLIVGAGETAELTAQALHAEGVRTMFVANRRREAAMALARRFGGQWGTFDALPEELQTFARWLGGLEVMPTLAALRAHGDAVVRGVLAENESRWESLSVRDRERVGALARAVVKRLLHEPTERVRALEPEHRHARL